MKTLPMSLLICLTLSLGACDDRTSPSSSAGDESSDAAAAGERELTLPPNNPSEMEEMSSIVDDNCDGFDDDLDGRIDEGQSCACLGDEQCYGAALETLGVGLCVSGRRSCMMGEAWGPCEGWVGPAEERCDFVDNDCDGQVNEDLLDCDPQPCQEGGEPCLTMDLEVDGDCVTVECPPEAPHPVACEIEFDGQDPRGCVAHTPGSSIIFLKEGNDCGVGAVRGSLTCSSERGLELNEQNCPMNKETRFYPLTEGECPVND